MLPACDGSARRSHRDVRRRHRAQGPRASRLPARASSHDGRWYIIESEAAVPVARAMALDILSSVELLEGHAAEAAEAARAGLAFCDCVILSIRVSLRVRLAEA